jgi:hypothetical protein
LGEEVKMALKNAEADQEMINQNSRGTVVEEEINQNLKVQEVNAVEEFNIYFALN